MSPTMVNVNGDQEKKRTSKGKQRIEIKKIDKIESKYVTFSKRRNGLFKKCKSLCSIYGSEFAVVTFSIAGKPMSDGTPSADAVIHRFLGDSDGLIEASWSSSNNDWWEKPVEKMSLVELEQHKAALEGLRAQVNTRVDRHLQEQMTETFVIETNPAAELYQDNMTGRFDRNDDCKGQVVGKELYYFPNYDVSFNEIIG